MPRRRQPGIPQQPPQNAILFNSSHIPLGPRCQYTSEQLARHLKGYGTRPSVGRAGVCWAESFNATLKNERVYQMVYPTRSKAVRDIASWIELEYNQKRLHSALGYRTPNEVEEEHRATRQAA